MGQAEGLFSFCLLLWILTLTHVKAIQPIFHIMAPLKVINNTGRVTVCVLSICAPRGPRKTDVFYIHISLMAVCRVSLHLFPLHLHAHTQQCAYSCTYLLSGTHTHLSCDRTGVSSEFFVCSLSCCHTQTHHTHACSCMCVYVLCCSCISAHTLAAWALCGWRKWRTMMGSLVCLVARVRMCVCVCMCVFVSLQCSDALTQR